jgi:hypothetical protein
MAQAAQLAVYNALSVFVSNCPACYGTNPTLNPNQQRAGATAILENLELSDPTYREFLALELVNEQNPVCFRSHGADVMIEIVAT